MTVSLRELIEEWEAINQDLYNASLESHQRYPFPSNLYGCAATQKATANRARCAPSSADSSTAAYTRVYHLVSRVRYIAEDARYNSFHVLQHLLWVTIAAWANQLAIASGGLIDLPAAVRRRTSSANASAKNTTVTASTTAAAHDDHRGGDGVSDRTSFPCSLLSPLAFWDPQALAEAAGGSPPANGKNAHASIAAAGHHAPNLPAVWADAVRRVFTLWCTPVNSFTNPLSDNEPAMPSSRAPAGEGQAVASGSHLGEAYVWILIAQHYHRFKAILSLFFLRYDAHLEEQEEQQRRRLGQRPQPTRSEADASAEQMAVTHSTALPLRRRGVHFRVPSGLSANSIPPNAAPSTTVSNSGSSGTRPAEERAAGDRPAMSAGRSSAPLPTTARLLALMMRNIETENYQAITSATGEAILFLLMPPVHRARLREKVVKAQQRQQDNATTAAVAGGDDARALDEGSRVGHGRETADPLSEPEWMASAFLNGCAAEEEDDDDEKIVWSAPPSPLLSFTPYADAPPATDQLSLEGNCNGSGGSGGKTGAARALPAMGRAQKEEYVVRHVFKLLLMTEDCRVYALQHWMVEVGKHVVAVYGAQLASLFFEDPSTADMASCSNNGDSASAEQKAEDDDDRGAPETPALSVRSLADANRVLRETLQSYVRLRTKLLFLNAGTTHFLEALTPWGRTRMLENLNAFLCGFCGVTLPSSNTQATAIASDDARAPALSPTTANDAAQYFTPTNAAVAAFARTWAVPLWLAMCDDTRQRLEVVQKARRKREGQRKSFVSDRPELPITANTPAKFEDVEKEEEHAKDESAATSENTGGSPKARTPSFLARYKKEPADGEGADVRSTTEGPEHSVASGDLGDAISRAPSGVWPPSSPTTRRVAAHTLNSSGGGANDFARVGGRGLDLRRVLQQRQRRRVSAEPFPQEPNMDNANAQRRHRGGPNSSDGGGQEESLYSAEAVSVGEGSLFRAAAAANDNVGGEGEEGGYREGQQALPVTSVEVAVAEARQRRRRAAAAAQHQSTLFSGPGATQRFSRAAQLHQVATLPDEGFPSLLYLMPRRSRFVAQDKAAAAAQQELFTRFSSDVHKYLSALLAECEAPGGEGEIEAASSGGGGERGGAAAASTFATATGRQPKRQKKRKEAAEARPAGEGEIRPLPQPVLTRMTFLLDMTYAALQGSTAADTPHGHTVGPQMETGLTTSGQEQGAAILEQDNGEYESVVSTTLSTPTSPAVLTIAAVRKGYQGFLGALEKRAVLTLAQALYGLIHQGNARQPPTVSFEAVDTLLNMASLLNSKDMFVSLMKGYIAPQVMMCRSLNDIAVESQVVARMAYRLGSAVAAPCLTLLRDLRLAISDPLSSVAGPLPFPGDGKHEQDEDDAFNGLPHDTTPANMNGSNNASCMTAEGSYLVATRDAQTLAAAGPLRHGLLGLIHHMRILCQAWWQPHTAVLLSSRRLQRLWERYQLLDERVIDAVLRVEWRYDGHTEPFYGYGRIPGDVGGYNGYDEDAKEGGGRGGYSGTHTRSNTNDSILSGGPRRTNRGAVPHHYSQRAGRNRSLRSSASANAVNARRGGAAAAVIQGFSSALNNAVRRTGHHAGAFGNNESDNESEDYSEAYGGLLTLNTLQRHRGAYTASNSSYRGSNVSSVGGGGTGDFWDLSDGRQSTVPDESTSAAVPPDGERARRQLRWPLGDGQLVFLLYSKEKLNAPAAAAAAATTASHAVQISGPPLALLVCQLMDRAVREPYTFDKLHKALPVQASKPLLAHLLHELVKAGVVTRSIPAGMRQYAYELRDDVQRVHQRRVVMDVRAAAQQHWLTRTLTAPESDVGDDTDAASQRDPMSPASPAGATPSFPSHATAGTRAPQPTSPPNEKEAGGHVKGDAATAAASEQNPPAYSVERMHKIKVCIVRVMKAERVLSHRDLLERVAAALEDQFVVTSGQLKRCVAHLMEKEFLQRSDSGEEYMYVS